MATPSQLELRQYTNIMVYVLKFRTLSSLTILPKSCYLCSYFFKILNGKANSVDPDQTAPSGGV